MELDYHLNLPAPETLESPSETSKQLSSYPLDDFVDQEFKTNELNLSLSSSSGLNSLGSDSNSSDYHSKDSSLDEEENQTCLIH